MSEPQTKRAWPRVVALMIGLLMLYVASFGPACWISSRTGNRNHPSVAVVEFVFQPLLRSRINAPEPIGNCIGWYAELGAERGWYIRSTCFGDDCYWVK